MLNNAEILCENLFVSALCFSAAFQKCGALSACSSKAGAAGSIYTFGVPKKLVTWLSVKMVIMEASLWSLFY